MRRSCRFFCFRLALLLERGGSPPPCAAAQPCRPQMSTLVEAFALMYTVRCVNIVQVLSCLLHMPQLKFALGYVRRTAEVYNLGKSWGMCSRRCNSRLLQQSLAYPCSRTFT